MASAARYELIEPIAKGDFATVFRARDGELGKIDPRSFYSQTLQVRFETFLLCCIGPRLRVGVAGRGARDLTPVVQHFGYVKNLLRLLSDA